MITNPKEILEVSDKIVAKPFKYGFIGAVSSVILLFMHHLSFVKIQEFGLYFLSAIYIALAFSLALIIWGVFFSIHGWWARRRQIKASEKSQADSDKARALLLLENLDRLSGDAKMLICDYIEEPSGRLLSPSGRDYAAFNALKRAHIIELENPNVTIFTASGQLKPGTYCCVDRALYSHLKATDPDFRKFKAKYQS